MFVLFSFGTLVSAYFDMVFPGNSIFYFLLLYLGGLLISAAPAFGKHKNNLYYNSVGASGAVSAILFSSIVFDPMNKIYLMFIPIGIPAILFGVLYLVYSAYMDKKGNDNIGHDLIIFSIKYLGKSHSKSLDLFDFLTHYAKENSCKRN
jgi:uncharacterized membrane protein HdeD (DUF308 family)